MMKYKIMMILTVLCVSCVALVTSGCVDRAAEHTQEQIAVSAAAPESTESPEYMVFNDESIRLRDYASLISLFGQLSYENVTIEDEDDFIDAASEYDMEHLSDLYSYISSLSNSDAAELHRIMLEALNNA